MALYTYSHLWLCGTMTRAIKYLSFSPLLFCTPFGLDRDLSTLSFRVYEWPSCLQPAYKISPFPFPNYQHLSRHNLSPKLGQPIPQKCWYHLTAQCGVNIQRQSDDHLFLHWTCRCLFGSFIIFRDGVLFIISVKLCIYFFKLLTVWWCFRQHPWHTVLSL